MTIGDPVGLPRGTPGIRVCTICSALFRREDWRLSLPPEWRIQPHGRIVPARHCAKFSCFAACVRTDDPRAWAELLTLAGDLRLARLDKELQERGVETIVSPLLS